MYEEDYFVELPKVHVKIPNITLMCLNPRFRLRTQMMLSFGMTAVVALGSFVLIGLYTASNSGKSVQNQARGVVTQLVKHSLSSTAQYVAETMTKKFNNIGGAGSLIAEVTRDRFVGYPNLESWEQDAYVPFRDSITGDNIYPLDATWLPLDWQIQGNVNATNYEQHILDRPLGWYAGQNVDTNNAAFYMQGACDPLATNQSDPKYLQGCTEEHNNVRQGGAIAPTPTAWSIYTKAKDITWVLKPLYESHSDVKTVGVFFANSGAGAQIQYPATVQDGTDTFESIGCEWMYTVHPRSQKLIASTWEIDNCHPYGANVTMREYNPLERQWCRDQVERDMQIASGMLSPEIVNVMATGPYLDALSAERLWVLSFGQAVFDRATDQFIACTLIDVSVAELYGILEGSSKVGDTSESALSRWDDFGTIVVASQWDPRVQETGATLVHDDLGLGVTPEIYQEMKTLVDYSQPWDPAEVQAAYKERYFVNDEQGQLIMMAPVPTVPDQYDPLYHPEYLIIIAISGDEAYGLLDDMEALIEQDVTSTWEEIGLIGGIGFGVVVLMIGYISSTLTKPLRWMQKVAGMIIDNAGGADLKKGLAEVMDDRDAHPWCAPRTEVTKLLKEFEQMIHEFSTEGAAEVAGMKLSEVKNTFEWRRMYEDIYPWETEIDAGEKVPGTTIPRQLSITHAKFDPEVFEDELTTDSTTNTDRSLFSVIGASVAASLVQASYSPSVQNVLTRTNSLVDSVKTSLSAAAIKAGILKEPEPERVQGPPFVNRGENLEHSSDAVEDYFEGVAPGDNSFLFWWTTLLVGTPILVTAIMISVSVASSTTSLIPIWLEEVKDRSFIIERDSIITANQARTFFGEEVLMRFVRDLHVYSRLAGWLLFGGIGRANSFTEVARGADLCKDFSKWQCPWFMDPRNAPCDCAWNDPVATTPAPWNVTAGMVSTTCQIYPDDTSPAKVTYNMTDSRYLQRRYFEGQRDDIDAYGTRMNSSFPAVGNHSYETNWWNYNMSALPGSYKNESASGYNTTYDRVRVTSAMSVVDISLYNYNPGIDEQKNLGTFVAFEQDGMMTGYTGCGPTHVNYPHWRSTASNGGPTARPLACPDGKYGYDARCRSWYANGKAKRGVYVAPPYLFASSGSYGGSATFSLEDPFTNEHVGQTLMDFLPDAFMRALDSSNTLIGHGTTGFPVVITPEADAAGNEVLVGPRYKIGQNALIADVVLPFDSEGSRNREYFEEMVASKMRKGEQGHAVFPRTTQQGLQERVFMSYAPLEQRTLVPVNSSDFGAGCTSDTTLIYSLGFGITMDDLVLPFTEVEADVTADVRQVQYISLALIVCAVLSVLYMTYTMCLYLSKPIMVLIAIVKSIRNKNLQDELPALDAGSCEIYDVYESLEQLCKIVRFSNTAVLKGDRNKSYKIMEDAVELFLRMDNQKALGVANNNLGTMVLQEQMERSSVTSRNDEVFFNGMKYFEEAIRIGTFEYQNAEFDDERGNFVKQLANRYFNRGMFYIVNRDHPMATPDLEATGVNDLVRAKQLDQEAYLLWRERGQLVDQACNEFGCILRRARGILTLMQDSDFQDVWGIEGLIEKANDMIHNPAFEDSNLFDGVNLVARKQQVNDLRIQFAMAKGETFEAAQVAIRILVEDEYIIDTVIMNCVTTLNKYYDLQGGPMQVPDLAKGVKRETRRGAVDSLRQAKNVIFCLDYSGSMNGERMGRANQNLLWVYEDHCLDKDYVGFVRFNHAVDTKLYFDLGRKGDNQEHHEDILRQATDAEGGTRLYAALNKCVTMALESGNEYDTWIIAFTDGESAWDFPAKSVIARIAKNNKKEGSQIHVVIIGFEVSSEVADSVSIITRITEKSMYIDAKGGLDEIDRAFETVASVITGTAITMETF